MKPPLLRAFHAMPGEIVVDNFAGGGGATTGIEEALGRPVDVAINHDARAIAMHQANHPETKHFCEDIWKVDPKEACGGKPVGLAWFSPDCTHFSKAKGAVPLRKEIRGLAWVVIRWAKDVRPRVIVLENVEEFQTWGPLGKDHRPIKAKAGQTFRRWLGCLTKLGYKVEHRTIVAADHGTPTIRKRMFLVARCDGGSISWPQPTHGKGRPKPHRVAAEIIDWSLPVTSIFGRKKPLADATLRRIAVGVKRYVLDAAEPFIIPLTHTGDSRVHGIDEPVRTITTAHRGELAVVTPFLSQYYGGNEGRSVEKPLGTVTAWDHHAMVTPFLAPVKTQGGGGNEPRSVEKPTRTVMGHRGGDTALCVPLIVKNNHGRKPCSGADEPLHTVTTQGNRFSLVSPTLIQTGYGERKGQKPRVPGLGKPLGTVMATGRKHALVASFLSKFYGTAVGSELRRPAPTVTGQGQHVAEVRAFLMKYYGAEGQGQPVQLPLHTVTSKARFGLVTIHGEDYEIVDIGMRMLQPHELFAAQGFPDGYKIAPTFRGKQLTKTDQIELAGNSVCPQVARAVVQANVGRAA